MEAVADYVKTLSFFMIFAAFVQIIAPSGSYKKYISLVLSLILIGLVLEPVGAVIDILSAEKGYLRLQQAVDSKTFNNERERYESWQAEAVIKEYVTALNRQIADVVADTFGVSVGEARVLVNSDSESEGFGEILGVHMSVYMAGGAAPSGAQRALLGNAAAIGGGYEAGEMETMIKNCVSDFYNVSADNIHITVLNDTTSAIKHLKGE